MKRFLSFFLVFVFVVAICVSAPITITANAAATRTKAEAVAWVNSRVNQLAKDTDGYYSSQCVDFIQEYYAYLGVSGGGGNACAYAYNTLPSGFTRIQDYIGFVPEPGDIAVWNLGWYGEGYGHVGIVLSADLNGLVVADVYGAESKPGVHYNSSTGKTISVSGKVHRTSYYPYSGGSHGCTFWGIIRPAYKTPVNTNLTHTISYNANGGSGAMSSYNIRESEKVILNGTSFVRPGYKQIGWNWFRKSDSKWFVWDKGWKTESEIASKGFTKHLYPLYSDEYIFSSSSCVNPNNSSGDEFVFYAVWQQCLHESGVIVVNSKNATYDANGYTGDKKCKLCGEIIEKGVTIPKLGISIPVVKSANTSKGIKVTWNKIAEAQKYIVYQRIYNASTKKWGGWKVVKNTTGLSYVDTSTKIGTYYSYTVRAVNGTAKSSFKATKGLKYDVKPVVKVANASNGIKVTWSTVANATGYTVYSSTYNAKTKKWSAWKNRGTAAKNKTAWVDKSAKAGIYYKYTVRAVCGKKASSYKASSNIIRLVNPTVKLANAASGVSVKWNKIAGTKNYRVYRSVYDNKKWSEWKTVATVKNNVFSYVDKNVESGKTYRYTVKAINGKMVSTHKSVSILFLSAPKPTVELGESAVHISWNKIKGANYYDVYRSAYNPKTKKWGAWGHSGRVTGGTFSCSEQLFQLDSGITYRYTVRAVYTPENAKSGYIPSNKITYVEVVVNSSNVRKVFLPALKYYFSLSETQHSLFTDSKKNYIDLLPESWFQKYGVSEDSKAWMKVYKFKSLKSPEALKNAYRKYLSDTIIEERSYMFSGEQLLVKDGAMYTINNYARGSTSYDVSSIEYRGKMNGGYLVAVDLYGSGDNYCGTEVFFVKSVNGVLRIESLYKTEQNHSWQYTNPDAEWINSFM